MSVKSYLPYRYKIDYSQLPFFVENISNSDATLYVRKNGDPAPSITVEYSTDNTTWVTLGTTTTSGIAYNLPARKRVYLRCTASAWSNTGGVSNIININQSSIVGGNTMSLLYGGDFQNKTSFPSGSDCNFWGLFSSSKIADASNLILPATTLTSYCYRGMFNGCTTLTTPPKLPAITLTSYCYQQMFEGCSSLSVAPELPATTLAYGCYAYMFYNCSTLTTAPELPATTPATYCYQYMFNKCKRLSDVTIYADDISATGCLNNWLSNVASTGTFHNNGNATYPTDSASGIPTGWTEVRPSRGTGWTPDDPLDVTGDELEGMLGGGAKADDKPEASIGYFYNVTKESKVFKIGEYVVTDPSTAVLYNKKNSMTFKDFKEMAEKGNLSKGDIYYTTDEEKVYAAVSTSDYQEIQRKSPTPKNTGWTPDDPIEMGDEDFDEMIKMKNALQGYFYYTPKRELQVAVNPGYSVQFDKKRVMSEKTFNEIAGKDGLEENAVYYTDDSQKVFIATGKSKYEEITRTTPKSTEPIAEK